MTKKQLEEDGYEILNGVIKNVSLTMADHGCLTSYITVEGAGFGVSLGGYCLGHGYLGSAHFDASGKGLESIMRIMDVVGEERYEDLKGKYVRIASKGWGSTVSIIGNILNDKWFDYKQFFSAENNP